jgi:hypothetical protein
VDKKLTFPASQYHVDHEHIWSKRRARDRIVRGSNLAGRLITSIHPSHLCHNLSSSPLRMPMRANEFGCNRAVARCLIWSSESKFNGAQTVHSLRTSIVTLNASPIPYGYVLCLKACILLWLYLKNVTFEGSVFIPLSGPKMYKTSHL